jgi:hypothetical protein
MLQTPQGLAQRHERHQAVAEESSKPISVSGGPTFQILRPYGDAFDATLNYLKKQGYNIDSASQEIGQIITAITVKGGWHQTDTRVMVTLIKDSESATTLRVAVTEQKRYKALQTELWGEPKVNNGRSNDLADQLKSALTKTQ